MIPERLRWLESLDEGRAWLAELPARIAACETCFGVRVGDAYPGSQVSLVLPARRTVGSSAVLKIQFPHRESEHEAAALACWDGQAAVRLLDHAPEHNALLLELCEPGTPLSIIDPKAGLSVLVALVPRLWRPVAGPFTTLTEEAALWCDALPRSWERTGRPFERRLVDAALETLDGLAGSQGESVLLHQDLHGQNVLWARREPWLVIDPKPLVGEREFSVAPVVRAYEFGHSRDDVLRRLDQLTEALDLDRPCARGWAFAQTLAWAFEADGVLPRHVETARWLFEAGG